MAHHLLDVMDVTEEASVARFQADARACFADIRARGRTPILVGGSGLYVRAALDVLDFPPTDPAVRAGPALSSGAGLAFLCAGGLSVAAGQTIARVVGFDGHGYQLDDALAPPRSP